MEMPLREIPRVTSERKRKLEPHNPELDHQLEGTPIDNVLVMLAVGDIEVETAVRILQGAAHEKPFRSTSDETFQNMDMIRLILQQFEAHEITKSETLTLLETQITNARERLVEEKKKAEAKATARQRQQTTEGEKYARPEIPIVDVELLEAQGWAPARISEIDEWQGEYCPFPENTAVSFLRVRPTEQGEDIFLYKTSLQGPPTAELQNVKPFVFIVKTRAYRNHPQAESHKATVMVPAQELPGEIWVAKLRDIRRVYGQDGKDQYEPVLRSWQPTDDETVQRWFERAYVPELGFVKFVTILGVDDPKNPGKRLRYFMESRNQPDAALDTQLLDRRVRQIICQTKAVPGPRGEVLFYKLVPVTEEKKVVRSEKLQTQAAAPQNERQTNEYDRPFTIHVADDDLDTSEMEALLPHLRDISLPPQPGDVLIGEDNENQSSSTTHLSTHPRRGDGIPDHTRFRARQAAEELGDIALVSTEEVDLGAVDTLDFPAHTPTPADEEQEAQVG